MVRVTTDTLRGEYNRIAEVVAAELGISTQQFHRDYKMMQFNLLMAVYLNPATSTYELSPRKGVDPAIPVANLLDMNDFFAMTAFGLKVGRAAFAAGSGAYSNHGNYFKFSFPDPNFFNGTGTTAGSEAQSLMTLVNGTTDVNISGDVVLERINNQNLMFNPLGTYTGSPVAFPTYNGGEAESRGLLRVQPHIILDASADNKFTVNVANGAKGNIDGSVSTGTTDSGVRNILYVDCWGWKIKNLGKGAVQCPVKA